MNGASCWQLQLGVTVMLLLQELYIVMSELGIVL